MSQHNEFKIPQTSDRTVIRVFQHLATHYDLSIATGATATAQVQLGALPLNEQASVIWQEILELDSKIVQTCYVSKAGFNVAYSRGGFSNQKSAIYDEIRISLSPHGGEPSVSEILKIGAYLTEELNAFDPDRALGSLVTEESKQVAAIHYSTLERLEKLAEDIIQKTLDTQTRLEKEYAEKNGHVDKEVARRKEELELLLSDDHEKLREKERSLDAKLKEIDDRGNTHARREMRDRMLDDVKQRILDFGVSKQTERKRQPVQVAIFALIATLVLIIISTLGEIDLQYKNKLFPINVEKKAGDSRNSSEEKDRLDELKPQPTSWTAGLPNEKNAEPAARKDQLPAPSTPAKTESKTTNTSNEELDQSALYLLWIRLSALTFGLIGTILYYIRWQNRWAEQHSSSEFQLQQFYVDVNRANWIIESGLEWRKETMSEIPEIILTSLTKNLFSTPNEPAPALHPADELASALLGTASKLKLKTGDSEMEFDKPSKIPNKQN